VNYGKSSKAGSMRLTLSRLKTAFYRQPKDELQRFTRWGPRAYFRCEAWAQEMEAAAWKLPVVETTQAKSGNESCRKPLEVWFLTGKRFWYQTAFCAWSLARQSDRRMILNLVDDGTMEGRHEQGLRRLFPDGITVCKEEIHGKIETLLPENRFPILRQRWIDYVNIRKLIDVHLGSKGVKLVLDSDMLFFRRPDALLEWWDAAQGADSNEREVWSLCLMTDCVESYGYSRKLMEELAGASILPLLNVGICGLRSEMLDWERLEHWCRRLLEREGTSYYLEQALVAMLAARQPPTIMPAKDYITFPRKDQVVNGRGVLQHYVADSKPWYFGRAWKKIAESHDAGHELEAFPCLGN